MKKALKIIGALTLIYLVIYSCNSILTNKLDSDIKKNLKPYNNKEVVENDVENTIKTLTQRLPINSGDGMNINKIEYLKSKNQVIYYYQTSEKVVSELTNEQIVNYKTQWKNNVIGTINNNPNNKSFVEAKVTFVYNLVDKNGTQILDFDIASSEYN
jgi:hypothetical protein